MHAYDTLELAYRRLAHRPARRPWLTGLGTPDELVDTIRGHQPDPTDSDRAIRALLALATEHPDALTIVLYALAPALRARTSKAITDEYRNDALTDLAFVLLDGHGTDRRRLAHRFVNRAHNRTHQHARRVLTRGKLHRVQVMPTNPDRLDGPTPGDGPMGPLIDRLELARFHRAVQQAILDGIIGAAAWDAYRYHRLARALDPALPGCGGSQRVLAGRTERRLRPIIETYLHAA